MVDGHGGGKEDTVDGRGCVAEGSMKDNEKARRDVIPFAHIGEALLERG